MKLFRPTRRGDLDSLSAHHEPVPRPQRGEVLVRVRAVSLNYRDLLLLGGGYPLGGPDNLVPVSDAAGEVAEIGEGVRRFSVGDRVIDNFHSNWFAGRYPGAAALVGYGHGQDGWLAEYRVVSEQALTAVPRSLSFERAATLPCAAVTAWTALGGPRPVAGTDTVLTQGTGGVSLFAVQLAKALGARVIATTSSAEKAARLRALGVEEVVDYRETPEWGDAVVEATAGRGVDRIVEVGGPGTFAQSLVAAGSLGADISLVGFLAGGVAAPVEYMRLFGSGATIRRINVGSREDTEDLLRFVDRHSIEPVIDSVIPFENSLDALRYFRDRGNFGKVVIAM